LNPEPQKQDNEAQQEEPKSWRRWYSIVLAELVLLIVAFYLFTKAFE